MFPFFCFCFCFPPWTPCLFVPLRVDPLLKGLSHSLTQPTQLGYGTKVVAKKMPL